MNNQDSDQDDEDFLREHYESEKYRGRLESPTVSFQMLNQTCGDSIKLDLQLKDKQITQAKFEAQGCVISQAAAAILCDTISGMELASLEAFDAFSMLRAIRIPLSPRRKRCGLLAWEVVQKMILDLKSQAQRDEQQ